MPTHAEVITATSGLLAFYRWLGTPGGTESSVAGSAGAATSSGTGNGRDITERGGGRALTDSFPSLPLAALPIQGSTVTPFSVELTYCCKSYKTQAGQLFTHIGTPSTTGIVVGVGRTSTAPFGCVAYAQRFASGDSTGSAGETDAQAKPAFVWHHLVVTHAPDLVRIYHDGVQTASGTAAPLPITSGPNGYSPPVQVKAQFNSNGEATMSLGPVATYSRALTAQEVADHYAAWYADVPASPGPASGQFLPRS